MHRAQDEPGFLSIFLSCLEPLILRGVEILDNPVGKRPPWSREAGYRVESRSLHGRRDRSEKAGNRGQIFSTLRHFLDFEADSGSIQRKIGGRWTDYTAFAVDSFCRAGSYV